MTQSVAADGSIAILIPAAGRSRRLGTPKQLKLIDGEPLLRRSVRVAMEAALGPTIVTLASGADEIASTVSDLACTRLIINDADEGMAASIRAGVAEAMRQRSEAVMVMLADQWGVTAGQLRALAGAYRRTRSIVAARYDGIVGVPAVFGERHFKRLLQLRGDAGARTLLRDQATALIAIDLPSAAFDLDEMPPGGA